MSHKERKDMVDRDHNVLSLSRQCELLHISRGSLYYQAIGETAANLLIMRRMDELFMLYPFYGSRQMMRHLQREGFDVGRHRVRRLMKLMGLKAIYRKPRTSDPHPENKTYPYLLRGLTITKPNHVWCTEPKISAEQQNYFYPDAARLSLSGGDYWPKYNMGDAPCAELAFIEQYGYRLLH